MSGIYLDHAATTPCREEVWEAMRRFHLTEFGNPNSLHTLGRRARGAIEEARARMATCLGCGADEVVVTSGGSESNSLAVWGVAMANRERGAHVITTRIEHVSALRTCEALEAAGFSVTYLGVNRDGRVTPEQVAAAVRPDTILITLAHANNEIGTIQPVAEISRAVKARRGETLVHTDAVQTAGHLPMDVNAAGIDLMTFASHKFYGPKGVGGLFVRRGVAVDPLCLAGSDVRGLHAGTESVPLIVGMALAFELACREMASETAAWQPVRDCLIDALLAIEGSHLNGPRQGRLPTNVNVSFDGVDGEDLVLLLDREGVAASTGSACSTGRVDPSHVIQALGASRATALGALRLTFGRACADLDPVRLGELIARLVAEQRSTSYRQPRLTEPVVAIAC